jgi:hypothetical protein
MNYERRNREAQMPDTPEEPIARIKEVEYTGHMSHMTARSCNLPIHAQTNRIHALYARGTVVI